MATCRDETRVLRDVRERIVVNRHGVADDVHSLNLNLIKVVSIAAGQTLGRYRLGDDPDDTCRTGSIE